MNKLFTKIVGAALGLTMAIGVGVAVGIGASKEAVPVHAAATDGTEQVLFNSSDSYAASTSYTTKGAIKFKNSATNSYSNPTRIYANNTFTIEIADSSLATSINGVVVSVASGYTSISHTWAVTSGTGSISGTSSGSSLTGTTSGTVTGLTIKPGSQARWNSVTVYYAGASTKTLSSISVETAPTKTIYSEGEKFDPTGLVITRNYTNPSSSDTYTYANHTSEFSFSPSTLTELSTSDTKVTITYGGKSTSQAITVTAPKTPASVSSSGQTTTFDAGDTFAYGGTLTATYTDSTGKTVSPTSFKIGNAGINPTSAGTVITPGSTALSRDDHNGKTVYVLYTENNTTVYTSYVITVNKISKITLDPTVTSSFPYQGITLTVTDGTLTNKTDYRVYKNQTMTIKSTVGDMAKIEFTYDSASYDGGGWSSAYTPNASTWTSPTASGEQARITKIIVTLASADPLVELDVSSATSVNMLDGDTNSTVKVLAKNIDDYTAWVLTFDEDDDTGLSSSDYVTVVPGAFSNNVSTFAITAKKVGSTILNIQLDGTDCEDTVKITIGQKPASITITHSDVYEKDNKLQLDLKAGGAYKQMTFSGKDIRGNTYAVAAADVTPSIQSGSSYVSVSGTRITPTSTAGTAVVRYELNDDTDVFVDLTVNVISDRNVSVNNITYVASASGVQGEPLKVSDIISATSTTTLFGETGTIADGEYLFAYSNNRSIAVGLGNFVYEITDDTLDAGETENREIFVFVSFDESYVSSTHVDIEVADRPLTAISLDTGASLSLNRNKSHQLEVSYTPYNTTSTRAVTYAITASSSESSITVSDSGLISAGSKIGSTATIKVTSQFSADICASVNVTVTREAMTITYDIPEEWVETSGSDLAVGDQVILTGVKNSVTYAAGTYSSGNNVPADTTNTLTVSGTKVTGVVSTMIYTLEEGTVDGSVAFKDSSGKYLYAAATGSNNMKSQDKIDANASFTIDENGNVVATESSNRNRMRYNNSNTSNLFSCYGNDNTGTTITFYKLTGGSDTITVGDDLFNDLMDYYYSGDFFKCDPDGATFDGDGWKDVGEVLADYKDTYKLNYARANASGNEVEQFLATYDYVVAKYGASYDYLGRIASGKISGSALVNPLVNIIGENTNSVVIIVIISMISITSIGGYFFLRKRKEI
ncbi:MAG: hypothetical protein MJ225_02910 [Bacilli bacterium]|nr:hypothetical protein [Bacilli bacterium]